MNAALQTISSGKVVTFKYTLTADDGTVLDESGDEGMPYLHGAGNIVPGLEKQMLSKGVGDKFRAVVEPEDAYGERVAPTQKIPRSAFPDDVQLEEGMQFFAESPEGDAMPMWVVGVSDDTVEVDLNHPLAGITLTFEVEVIGIREATEEELAHGHPHEPGHEHHH
jgi:FKBP-type peptidyl-prolyl cis-trans isomerase SlyD